MKVSKRALIGATAVLGSLGVGGSALYWMSRGDASEPEAQTALHGDDAPPAEPSDLNPIPDGTSPPLLEPTFDSDLGQIPSPSTTVRGQRAYGGYDEMATAAVSDSAVSDPGPSWPASYPANAGGLEASAAGSSRYSTTVSIGDSDAIDPNQRDAYVPRPVELQPDPAQSNSTQVRDLTDQYDPARYSNRADRTAAPVYSADATLSPDATGFAEYTGTPSDGPAAPPTLDPPDFEQPGSEQPDLGQPDFEQPRFDDPTVGQPQLPPANAEGSASAADAPRYQGPAAFEGSQDPVAPRPLLREAPLQTTSPAASPPYPAVSQQPDVIPQRSPDRPQELPLAAADLEVVQSEPGSPRLEGVQTPSVAVEKIGPQEIQVDIPATFEVRVRNVGSAIARDVTLMDPLPSGTEYISSKPEAQQSSQGMLVWSLGDLAPGDERTVALEVLPKIEGDIGSVAQVTFNTAASVRSVCTKPMLEVQHTAPAKVLIGEDVVFAISITNPGSGAATGVVIEEDVPVGLSHSAGRELESEIGTLQPNETRQMELVVQASSPGQVINKIRVRGNGQLFSEHTTSIEVVAPELAVAIAGPTQRYVERSVTYEVQFENAGTAPAKNVDLVLHLPKGLEFVSAEKKGRYDSAAHAVMWSLVELPERGSGSVTINALPLETGEQVLRLDGTADLNLESRAEFATKVASLTELEFSIADTQDPIEVGSETTYEIRVVNNGAKAARNIQVAAKLPPEVVASSADGATEIRIDGQQVLIEPIRELPPRGEAMYRIKVTGQRPGDHVIDVWLTSEEVTKPVMKQESTKVYQDR